MLGTILGGAAAIAAVAKTSGSGTNGGARCKYCGGATYMDDLFCTHCGKPLDAYQLEMLERRVITKRYSANEREDREQRAFALKRYKWEREKKYLCILCGSEPLYTENLKVVPCRNCKMVNHVSTIISAVGCFYPELKEGEAKSMRKGAMCYFDWTDYVKYALDNGLIKDNASEYERIMAIDDPNELYKLYQENNHIAGAKLGDYYAKGAYFEQDSQTAYKLFLLASFAGESFSNIVLSEYLFRMEPYRYYSADFLHRAAVAENPIACLKLAIRMEGNNNLTEFGNVQEWLEKAIGLGLITAKTEYAMCCESNLEEKIALLKDCLNRGDEYAGECLGKVYNSLYLETWQNKYLAETLKYNNYNGLESFMYEVERRGRNSAKLLNFSVGEFDKWLYDNVETVVDALIAGESCTLDLPQSEIVRISFLKAIEKNCVVEEVTDQTVKFLMGKSTKTNIDDRYRQMPLLQLKELVDAIRFSNNDEYASAALVLGQKYESMEPSNIERKTVVVKRINNRPIKKEVLDLEEEKSLRYYLLASALGNAEAFFRVAQYKEKMRERKEDIMIWYRNAALKGNTWAAYRIAFELINNQNFEAQKAGVAMLLRSGLDGDRSGNVANMFGICFSERKGLRLRDYDRAQKCFRFGADKKNCHAMFNLADAYEKGIGVPIDFDAAGKWYLLADENGHPKAISRYDWLYRNNKLNRKNQAVKKNDAVSKADVREFLDRVNTHMEAGYYTDAATNVRHIEETILDYFVQLFIPESIYDNKGAQKRKLSEMKAIPEHYIEILFNIGKLGNSGAHAKGGNNSDLTRQDIERVLPPINDLISFYENY